MRLVEGAQGKEGELPAAQTCGWSDDDEDMDSDKVAFKAKGDMLFGKLGNSSKASRKLPLNAMSPVFLNSLSLMVLTERRL